MKHWTGSTLRLFCSFFLLLTLVWGASSFAEVQGFVEVSGSAFLQDTTDHSGIRVLFQAISPSAVTDSAFTDSNGDFSQFLQVGIYDVFYSKDHYLPVQLPGGQFFSTDTVLTDVTMEPGDPEYISGNLSGRLFGDIVYFVVGDIYVQTGDTLVIEPGTSIRFKGYYKFEILGLLLAQGAEGDSITFTSGIPTTNPGDWRGITFGGSAANNSMLAYCRIQFGEEGIVITSSNPQIENCNIQNNNRSGIHCNYSSSTITRCIIQYNKNSGIYCQYSFLTIADCTTQNNHYGIRCVASSPTITQCLVQNNYNNFDGFGISCETGASPTITQCIVQNNSADFFGYGINCVESSPTITHCIVQNQPSAQILSYGIMCSGGTPTITQCTVQNNSQYGIYCQSASSPMINTSIIRGNLSSGISNSGATPTIIYSDFFENAENFSGGGLPQQIGNVVTTNANGDSCDTYFNIFLDPLQASPPDTLTLLPGSPCIDAGDPTLPFDPDSTIADMGASIFYQVIPDSPMAAFTANPLIGTVPLNVAFTNLSTGVITSYWWDFGDGQGSPLREPAHYYIDPDTYTVTLTVYGLGGTSDVETKIDYIIALPVTEPPTANFTATPTSGFAPLEVTFTNLTTGDVDSLKWYFGDGDSSSAANPVHTYAAPDTYTVRLVAYGPYGVDEETKVDYIKAREYPLIEAEFTTASRVGVPPFYVSFENQSLGVINSWLWTFGDGDSNSTDWHASHTYTEPGAYTVSLRVQGPNGEDTETKTDYIQVYQAAPTIISISDIKEDQGGKVQVRWLGSAHDGPLGALLAGYNVWQRYESEWNLIGSLHATQDSIYQFIAVTLYDSTQHNTNWTTFKISAHGTDPALIYYSAPDSGYSVDNLAPDMPQCLAGEYNYPPSRLSLNWRPNTEHDLSGYRIYRGEGSAFIPSEQTLIATTLDTVISGLPYPPVEPWHFKVSAVDIHGNESEFAVLPPEFITIGTLVASYHSAWTGNCVEVRWVLDDDSPGLDYSILRKAGVAGEFEEFDCEVVRHGNQFSFRDKSTIPNETYTYKVSLMKDGREVTLFETTVSTPSLVLSLHQNYPNPFKLETIISFDLPKEMSVELTVYDIAGRRIRTLVHGKKHPGVHEVPFSTNGIASGVYFYKLRAGDRTITKKMVIAK